MKTKRELTLLRHVRFAEACGITAQMPNTLKPLQWTLTFRHKCYDKAYESAKLAMQVYLT